MSSSSFPPGFCFYPTEEELLGFYLHNKLENERTEDIERVIPVLDVYWRRSGAAPREQEKHAEGAGASSVLLLPHAGERSARREAEPHHSVGLLEGHRLSEPGLLCRHQPPHRPEEGDGVLPRARPFGTKTKWKMNDYRALDDQEQDIAILTSSPKVS
uniref:NAC domain-containing protein n=1 Tax=Ananas comosus var. bracteatus TaxID=296719 RepID=A0A6V7Q6F8_ANACO|nr:unnamed protein product [Ananas comosus var. bracteatus]